MIAVIVPSAAPHVAGDVGVYSARYGLPAPHLRVLTYGNVPPPAGTDDAGWEQEGTLDLEMAHALAPQAALIYLAVPDTDGTDGMPVMYDEALAWLVTRYRVTVVDYSEGIPEDWAAPSMSARDGYGQSSPGHAPGWRQPPARASPWWRRPGTTAPTSPPRTAAPGGP